MKLFIAMFKASAIKQGISDVFWLLLYQNFKRFVTHMTHSLLKLKRSVWSAMYIVCITPCAALLRTNTAFLWL